MHNFLTKSSAAYARACVCFGCPTNMYEFRQIHRSHLAIPTSVPNWPSFTPFQFVFGFPPFLSIHLLSNSRISGPNIYHHTRPFKMIRHQIEKRKRREIIIIEKNVSNASPMTERVPPSFATCYLLTWKLRREERPLKNGNATALTMDHQQRLLFYTLVECCCRRKIQ